MCDALVRELFGMAAPLWGSRELNAAGREFELLVPRARDATRSPQVTLPKHRPMREVGATELQTSSEGPGGEPNARALSHDPAR
jgi:hypothetical protein